MPFRKTAIPVADILYLLNMNCPTYIIGDFNIRSTLLKENNTNKFGKQFNILFKTGKVKWEGPMFPTFFGGKSPTTPDKIFTNNKAYYNIFAAPGPPTSSDHSILLIKISCTPIQISITERRCLKKMNWQEYKKDLEKMKA